MINGFIEWQRLIDVIRPVVLTDNPFSWHRQASDYRFHERSNSFPILSFAFGDCRSISTRELPPRIHRDQARLDLFKVYLSMLKISIYISSFIYIVEILINYYYYLLLILVICYYQSIVEFAEIIRLEIRRRGSKGNIWYFFKWNCF